MIAIEFRVKLCSMYSIRVPYSYQCARTYPLPAPSTIKGLCANALWRKEGGHPVEVLKEIQIRSLGATSKAEYPIEISSCTIRVIPTDARLRQFAFTPYIDCLIAFKDGSEGLGKKIAQSLQVAPVYLGDSESLACVVHESTIVDPNITCKVEGDHVSINTVVRFDLIKNHIGTNNGVVLYMQEDPIAADAVLARYWAPLSAKGDAYYPVDSFSFHLARKGYHVKGDRISALFPEASNGEETKKKSKQQAKQKIS